jgi:hypothetical protein
VNDDAFVAPGVPIPDGSFVSAHKYVGEPPAFTRPETFHVWLMPPQSVPDGGVIVNDGSGWIVIVYVSSEAQPPTVYS